MKTGPHSFTDAAGIEWHIEGLSRVCSDAYVDCRSADGKAITVRPVAYLAPAGLSIPADAPIPVRKHKATAKGKRDAEQLAQHALSVDERIAARIPAPHPVGCECGNCSHEHYGCLICGSKTDGCTPTQCETDMPPEQGLKAGRFVLFERIRAGEAEDAYESYVTSWDTWEEASAQCFPLPPGVALRDDETGQVWTEPREPVRATVVHSQREPYDIYIGRPGPWGNPYSHEQGTNAQHVVATREEAIEHYRLWLKARIRASEPGLIEALAALHGQRLGCWCAPQACHGDVLADAAEWAVGVLSHRDPGS
jgi:hypothetical protein